MFALTLFGGLSLESDAGPLPPAALQRRRLALLALLAVAGERGMPREKVHAHLWPDRPDERARHALEQLLYLTRRDLGRDAVLGDGPALRLNPDVVTSDLARFDAAVARADWSAAAQAYAGPLLDGVRLGDAPGFERWADEQRGACARRYACALEHLAGAAERDGAHADAAEWWRRRAALDPYSVAAALGLMRALAASGDRAAGVRHARVYAALVRNELAVEPDPAVVALAATLECGPRACPPRSGPGDDVLAPAAPAGASPDLVGQPAAAPRREHSPPAGTAAVAPPSQGTAAARRARGLRARIARVLLPAASLAALALAFPDGWPRRNARPDAAAQAAAAAGAQSAAHEEAAHALVPAASVAVLPLADVSSGRESDFFGDGMTEELIHALSRVPELRVAARTSVFALKGRAGDVRQIGRTLGVRSVLEGSVRRAGDRVRVNVRLVDASTGYERWAQSYDRRLSDVLAVQQEIAAAVAERLTDRLAPAGAGSAAATAAAATAGADTRSYQAFEHYLRGRHHLNQGGAAALARAADELGAAVAADPTYARAHAALADVYNRMAEERGARREQAALLARAEVSARRAITLDPRLAEAHVSLGILLLNRWDWNGAAGELRRAIAENPSFATAHERYGTLLALRGEFDGAVAAMRRARELDPLSLGIQGSTAYVLGLARRYPAAEAVARRLVAADSAREGPRFHLASALVLQGRYAEAVRELETALRLAPKGQNRALPLLGYTYARAGRTADAVRLRPVVERGLADHSVSPYFAAAYFGAVGEDDRAFALLDDLGSRRESCLRDLAVDPIMEPLHADPRFARVVSVVAADPLGQYAGAR